MAHLGTPPRVPASLLLALVSLLPISVFAAQIETLPPQQIPEPQLSPPPITGQPSEHLSLPSKLPAPQGNNLREIPLPQVFRGCWSGSVPSVDSMRPLSPDMGRMIWLTKTYTLCYKQIGYNGKWQLTFAEGAVADQREVSDQRQAIKVKSVSGPNRAELTAYLHFRTHGFIGFGGVARPSTLDELAHLHCRVIPEQDLMVVSAAVFVETNGEPYADVAWHTNFFRTGSRAD
jgi:hypothetical protein